jgi:hypothetical protein
MDIRFYSCIKRDPAACGVQYNIKYMGVGQTKVGLHFYIVRRHFRDIRRTK